jgi:transcriptional regulator with XRE-family HTH domain
MERSYASWAVPSLRQLRWKKLLTQRLLATRAHVAMSTIVRLEKGETAQIGTIHKLAKALGVTAAELLAEPEEDDAGVTTP